MINGLQSMVTGEQITTWLIIAFLVGYFIYKEWPEFKKRISKSAVTEKTQEVTEKTLIERLDAIEAKLNEMGEKLARDYDRINIMEKEQKSIRKMQRNSLKERGIIMRALLALMEGSEENAMIQQSEKEINEYLIEQSHQENEI